MNYNKKRLGAIHKFCKRSIKLKNFVNNISAITILGSYYIFNCRSQVLWPEMAPILAPFNDQWIHKTTNIHSGRNQSGCLQEDFRSYQGFLDLSTLPLRHFSHFFILLSVFQPIKSTLYIFPLPLGNMAILFIFLLSWFCCHLKVKCNRESWHFPKKLYSFCMKVEQV